MIATNSQTASDPASPAIPQLSRKSFADNAANVAKVATKAKMAGATNKMKMPAAQVERGTVQRRKTASKRRAVPNTKPVTPVAAKLTKGSNRQVTKTKRIAPPSKPVDREDPKLTKKVARVKIIRERVTMPLEDYERIEALKQKCRALEIPAKKSELLRAGLATLQLLSDEDLKRIMGAVVKIKAGRMVRKSKGKKACK